MAAFAAQNQIFPPKLNRCDDDFAGHRLKGSLCSAQLDLTIHSVVIVVAGGEPVFLAAVVVVAADDSEADNDRVVAASGDCHTMRGCAASRRSR